MSERHALAHASGPAPAPAPVVEAWSLERFAGRLLEWSGAASSAALTLAFGLVHEAQRRGEPAVWIGGLASGFYPPDVAAAGIDLAAFPVIRTQDALSAARAADLVLRSGAFALVVLDLGADPRFPIPVLTRLAGLAHRHRAALLCLTVKDDAHPSIGALVSLRARVARVGREDGRLRVEARVLKDKRRGPGWRYEEVFRGPDGLR